MFVILAVVPIMFDVVAAAAIRTVVAVVMAVVIAVVVVMAAAVLVAGVVVAVVRAAHCHGHHCRGQGRHRRGSCHHCGRVKSVVAELAVPGEVMIRSIRGRSALACVAVVGVIALKVRQG